jgi:hypothetical protein
VSIKYERYSTLTTYSQELRRLQQAADEKDKEIADLKQSLEEMKSEMKLKKGSGLKRVRKADKSDEDNRLTMSGKKYALTTRLWLPEVGLELQEDSTDPEQILLKEYIAALPPGEQEGYSKVATVRMVYFTSISFIYNSTFLIVSGRA